MENTDIARLNLHIKQKEWDKVITKKIQVELLKKLTVPSTKLDFELPRHHTQATGSSHHQSPITLSESPQASDLAKNFVRHTTAPVVNW